VAHLAFLRVVCVLFSRSYSYLGVGWREHFFENRTVPADLFDSTCGAGTLCYDSGASDLSGWLLFIFQVRLFFFFGSAGWVLNFFFFSGEYRLHASAL
jgi:hypothetical protein